MYKLVIGIDISKSTLDATSVRWNDKSAPHDSFLNKPLGFRQLVKWFSKFSSTEDKVLVCMEHTGYYSQALCEYLTKKRIEYALINPLKIKRSMGLQRGKSDKADSKVIAMYGLKFQEELHLGTALEADLLDLQLLLAHRKRLQDKELALQRHEKHLKHCVTGKTAKLIVRDIKRSRLYFAKQRKAFERQLDVFLAESPAIKKSYDLLTSIPGVGPMIAMNTIVCTRNFMQIRDPRKFSCYCGVAPFKHESGTSIRKGSRVSFFGNKKLKSLLNFGAMNAVKYDPQLKVYYQKKVAEGKSKMSVLNAVRNKLIHRMFAVINRQTPYFVQPVF